MKLNSLLVALILTSLLAGCGGSPAEKASAPPLTLSAGTQVSATNNPQVASYTIGVPAAGTVKVNFGTDTGYGRSTWAVPATTAGPVTILVAGMLPATLYHMQAVFTSSAGDVILDSDRTFTTGDVPAKFIATFKATTASGRTPQPGIELVDGIASPPGLPGPVATDLAGNIIWTYPNADSANAVSALSVRLLPNGHLLMLTGHNSSLVLGDPTGIDNESDLREVTLAGDLVQSLTLSDLNERLQAQKFNVVGSGFSHEVYPLANGHTLVLVTTEKSVVLTGASTSTIVLGDLIVDLDSSWQPVWVWSTFDHLDVNRHPFNFPDWTHANSLAYDSSDQSIIISLRHQNWVLKLNYGNGAGDGSILWKLGVQGDFTLLDSSGNPDPDPSHWFYSQHYANPLPPLTTGTLNLALMDNGDDRQFTDGTSCPVTGGSDCFTTIPILQLDQNQKTAKFIFHQVLSPNLYSFFGGDTEVLANGNVHYDLAGLPATSAAMYEVTDEPSPKPVWSLQVTNGYAYRGNRWPSLYPGVQW